MKNFTARGRGIIAGTASAVFLGLSPIFGKIALLQGVSPFAVVAIRTTLALFFLFCYLFLTNRQYFYIYPIGLTGCLIAGLINGIGSIFYYTALHRIDAGIGQLIYSFYPLFMVFWLLLDRQSVSKFTVIRLILVIPGVYLLLNNSYQGIDYLGALFMLIAAVLYALHLLITQRVLYDVPAPTVAFYTLAAMSVTVVISFLVMDSSPPQLERAVWPLLVLAVITFLSRISLFYGVKHLGGIQTALLGLGEILITVVIAQAVLAERLTPLQWVGASVIMLNWLLLTYDKKTAQKPYGKGFLHWLNPPSL